MILKLFYILKPLIPRSLQIFIRRKLVLRKKEKYKNVWPILEKAGKKPDGWPGWPGGKKFAFIITHDVELKKGHDKCMKLALIERALGFVSSFNFVPERYEVSSDLQSQLVKLGFEVGVHGLKHDGKLFRNKETFIKRSKIINTYLKKWNAVGFRAPAMHHNLQWIHKLDIEYDLSTFDTDPFEPQSDGIKTIFPFWVSKNGNDSATGYWEFPYTLVQDFTLFILMNGNNDIWEKKVDWIVQNEGMVLVNVHPDYINFSKNKNRVDEFSKIQYIGLLNYIKTKYKGQYWNPLPKELAEYLNNNFPKEYILLKN